MNKDDELKDGGPAFPAEYKADSGMTLRDWFAGQALPAIVRNLAKQK